MAYDYSKIELKWQEHWQKNQTFKVDVDPGRPKYYVLGMFPYPSGEGLHVGHPEGYTATDIMARFHRMCGYNVLHPMGRDAFGRVIGILVPGDTHPGGVLERFWGR